MRHEEAPHRQERNQALVCPETLTMQDQVVDATMARALHADACRDHALVAWVVMWDAPGYPEQFIARLATKRLSPYVLVANTLAGVQEQLPPGLVRAERQPADPPEVVEIWFA
jgi:hypothetical protein